MVTGEPVAPGENPFSALDPIEVLHIGDPASPLLTMLRNGTGTVVHTGLDDATAIQFPHRFDLVALGLPPLGSTQSRHRLLLHTAMQHLARGGHLAILHHSSQGALCDGFRADDLHVVGEHSFGTEQLSLMQRGVRLTVHDLVHEARLTIGRITPADLAARILSDSPPLIVDTRTQSDRARFGVISCSVHIPRTVLEWHLDPVNGYLHPAMYSFDQTLVIVCNGGYSSSLAAANLVRIGFTDVSDLIGGHTAWRAAGLPVEPPDHSHLDLPEGDDGVTEEL